MKSFLITILLFLPAFLFGQQQEDSVGYAISLLNGVRGRIDYPRGISILREYAMVGNAAAINALGIAHLQGLGVEKNEDIALSLLKESAQSGYANSWLNLGQVYANENSKNYDRQEAVKCFDYAIEGGAVGAYYPAAFAAYYGIGRDVNYDYAFCYFKRSAEMRIPESMYMLGLCYMNGQGTSQDLLLAEEWLENARLHGIAKTAEALENLFLKRPISNDICNLSITQQPLNGDVEFVFDLKEDGHCWATVTSSLNPNDAVSEDLGICHKGRNVKRIGHPSNKGVYVLTVFTNNNLTSITFLR